MLWLWKGRKLCTTLLWNIEQFSYPEALKFLAKKYHIEVPEIELTPEQLEKANAKESLYVVSNFANEFFQKQLQTNEGLAIAISYFQERG